MMNSLFKKRLIVEGIVVACAAPLAFADFLDLPTTPLITASAVEPNMMLLIDSSGSMGNIVPESYNAVLEGYDAATENYKCEHNIRPNNYQIDIKVVYKTDGKVDTVYFTQYDSVTSTTKTYEFDSKDETGYGCFVDSVDVIYSARLYANNSSFTVPDGYLSADYTGKYLNWYFDHNKDEFVKGKVEGTNSRLAIAKTAAIELVSGLSNIRVGLAIYGSSQNAKILFNIDELTTANKATLTGTNGTIASISNSGMTPLGGSMLSLGRYFTQKTSTTDPTLLTSPDITASQLFGALPTGATTTPPIQYWCQQSFLVALTDGLPAGDKTPTTTFQSAYGSDVDDIAEGLYDMDLRPDLTNDGVVVKNNVSTYMIGFADEQVKDSVLMTAAATKGGGEFITAADSTELASAFASASQSIFAKVASWSAVSFNSSQISDDSMLYQASFNTSGWSGSLNAYEIEDDGTVKDTVFWDAATKLDTMDFEERNIFSYNTKVDDPKGIEFKFGDLTDTQQADLLAGVDADDDDKLNEDDDAKLLVDYLRGDTSNEGSGSGNYRKRTSLLGDIVNSTSVYVGAPQLNWPDYSVNNNFFGGDKEDESYSHFKAEYSTSNYLADNDKSRPAMVYVGANDGMLHGFDAATGEEKFAYVPGSIYSASAGKGLHYLADQSYAHQFYVDLTPTVSDIYFDDEWHSILVGGLRAGGKGIFALDITDPNDFDKDSVLWEFSSANDSDFGYSYSRPSVAMMANGKWAVIVGNGYNSTNGKAKLFILFMDKDTKGKWESGEYVEIDTGVGDTTTPNGLSTPTVVDTNGDSVADRVYAGDLQGNMWVFDITHATDTTQWKVVNSTPLFTARNSSDVIQPITSAPTVTTNPSSVAQNAPNLLVFFGTGKYLEQTDISSNKNVMSYYAVLDDGGSTTKTRANLAERKLLTTTSGLRSISGSDIDWDDDDGWYVDLVDRSTIGGDATAYGERVISDSLVSNSVLFFNTIIPEGSVCSSGGESWLMSLSLATGLAPKFAIFDANGDDEISDSSTDPTDANSDGVADNGDLGYVGQSFSNGLASESSILSNVQYTMGSTGVLSDRDVNTVGASELDGRVSWQELIRD